MRSNLVTDRLTVSFSLRKLQRKLINYVQFKVFVTNYFRQKRRGGCVLEKILDSGMEFRSIIQSKLSKEDHIDFDADDVPFFFCFCFFF